ncbi:MAG: TonB-dependent receptor [Amphiplicatus sp.]
MKKIKTAASALLATTMLSGLAGAFAQDDEIVVRGARIPDEKRATSEISSVLDEASFQRTGDSDIAEALRRVTGLSLSQGRFVIVRGLNERYSSVTLNGSPLPSPEPLRRVVPLDIIPTSALSGSLVQKTFSPQYSAEFGGGLVELRTKALPDEFFLEIGGSIGLDSETTFRDGLLYDGGDLDWLGFDDGSRSLPAELAAIFESGAITSANQDAIDGSIDASRTTVISENTIPPNYGVNFAIGDRFEVSDDILLGGVIALSLSNDWQTREGIRQQGYAIGNSAGAIVERPGLEGQDVNFRSTENTVDLNGVGTFGVEIGENHKLTSTSLIFRSTEKQARMSEGLDGADPDGFIALKSNTRFLERQVWQTQLRGDHVFPALGDLTATWRAAYGKAFRDAPFQREYTYIRSQVDPLDVISFLNDGSYQSRYATIHSTFGDSAPYLYDVTGQTGSTPNTLSFSRIDDENIDAGVDFTMPVTVAEQDVEVKFGYAYTDKSRKTMTRNFEYESNLSIPAAILGSRMDQLLSESVVRTPLLDLSLLASGIDLDNSSSTLNVHAAYVGLDAEVGPYFRIAAGGRFEDSELNTTAYSTPDPTGTLNDVTVPESKRFFPAATVTWNPIGDLQIRAGFSQSITRPQFRELTPAFFTDDETDLLIRGNPFLQSSEINNYDIRAEHYFGRGQFVTLGAFYKEIEKPIEESFAEDIGGILVNSFINAPSAKLYGFEFEFEKNFLMEDLVSWSALAAKTLVVKANYTYSKSDVSANGTVITPLFTLSGVIMRNELDASTLFTDGRSLQGQSTHLANVQIGLEDEENRSRATLLFNFASSRIRNVEIIYSGGVAPSIIERPPIGLDFVYSKGFEKWGGDWEIGLKIKNILGEDYEATQSFRDGTVLNYDSYGLGREYSMSLKRSF